MLPRAGPAAPHLAHSLDSCQRRGRSGDCLQRSGGGQGRRQLRPPVVWLRAAGHTAGHILPADRLPSALNALAQASGGHYCKRVGCGADTPAQLAKCVARERLAISFSVHLSHRDWCLYCRLGGTKVPPRPTRAVAITMSPWFMAGAASLRHGQRADQCRCHTWAPCDTQQQEEMEQQHPSPPQPGQQQHPSLS